MPAAHAPRRVLVGLKALFDHSEGGQDRVDLGVAELRPADALLSVKSNSRVRSAFL